MTEQTNLDVLKAKADEYGIKYTARTTEAQLKKLIDKHENEVEQQVQNDIVQEVELEAMKLLRVIVTPMNPLKRDLQGDIFSVGNSVLPTFTKYVPYNVEWHIPQIMYEMLKEKQETVFHKTKDAQGRDIVLTKTIPAYNINVLPQLTPEELKELAKNQAVRDKAEELF